jgi:hypothetical protein
MIDDVARRIAAIAQRHFLCGRQDCSCDFQSKLPGTCGAAAYPHDRFREIYEEIAELVAQRVPYTARLPLDGSTGTLRLWRLLHVIHPFRIFTAPGGLWRSLGTGGAARDLRWITGRESLLQLPVQLLVKRLLFAFLARLFFLWHWRPRIDVRALRTIIKLLLKPITFSFRIWFRGR